MKKTFNILILVVLIILFIPNVNATNNISIENIDLVEKSDNTIELSKPTINGMNIGFDLSFLEIGNSAKYKVIINNNTNKDYYINNTNNFNSSDYVNYTYEFENSINKIKPNTKETMYITIKYIKNIPPENFINGIYIEENLMSIDLSNLILTKSILTNPITYSNIIILFSVFTILLVVTIIRIKKKKKVSLNIILILLLLIPIGTNALEKISIKVETKITIEESRNIIESRYVNGSVNIERDFWQYGEYIRTITFQTSIQEPSNYEYEFDVSEEKNDSIIAYLVENEEDSSYYNLYIMSNGFIYANPDSSYVFYQMINLKEINNIEYFKTKYATNMTCMFRRIDNMENLDLSSFDTSNVTDMTNMFYQSWASSGRGILKTIILDNWDTSKVVNMSGMFQGFISLEELDLSSFDTSNVTNMESMFYKCDELETLDLSSFDTSNVTNMETMFVCDYKLKIIYIGNNWNIDNVTNSIDMFFDCYALPNFDSSITDKTNANTSPTGYLTLKS